MIESVGYRPPARHRVPQGTCCWLKRCLIVAVAYGCSACAGSSEVVCHKDGITGSEQCSQSGGYGDAALTGGLAAGVWAAKGCTINGCQPPFTCNSKTKMCERLQCSETKACPPGYECSFDDHRCR